jgi:hypothetical protein
MDPSIFDNYHPQSFYCEMLRSAASRVVESGLCIGERRLTHNCGGVGSVGRQLAISKGDREPDPAVEQNGIRPAADDAFLLRTTTRSQAGTSGSNPASSSGDSLSLQVDSAACGE